MNDPIKNRNYAARSNACEDLERIGEQMKTLIQEARDCVRDHPSYNNWDAYVFRHLDENVENANPYNQSIFSIIESLNGEDEPVEDWDEEWEEES
jgi:hypothetical protein